MSIQFPLVLRVPFPLLFLLFCAIGSTVNTTVYPDCRPVSCGRSDVNITYPFWFSQTLATAANSSSYCGYQGLALICRDGLPTLQTSANNYTVLEINRIERSITVADAESLRSECPRTRGYKQTPYLDYTPNDGNLTFFFDCPNGDVGNAIQFTGNKILCLSGGGNNSYVFTNETNTPEFSQLHKFCDDVVVIPVQRGPLGASTNITAGFISALKKGFQLQWEEPVMKDCRDCEVKGGYCVYTDDKGLGLVFSCHCPSQNCLQCPAPPPELNRNGDPSQKKRIKKKRKIIAALSALSGFLVLLLVGFYLWCRYRKNNKRTSSLDNLIRSSSSKRLSMEKDTESHSKNLLTHIFSYKELEEATECFASSNELGDGGFGTVYKGKLRDGRIVAVKRLYENNYKRVEQFLNEVEILNLLRHQNLVTLYGCTSRHSRELLLVYEYVANGTVADHLHGSRANEDALTWPIRMDIAIETASALKYLHAVEPQVIHRDVKTNNILLDENYRVKVADFGLSRLFPPHASHVSTVPQGTPGYVDPEYHQCYKLTDKSDVYSFGVVLVELISSKPAVDITRHRHEINLSNMAINKIQHCLLHELVDLTLGFDTDPKVRCMIESVAEVAFRCLQAEKEMRPSMEEVLELLQGAADRELKEEESPADTDKKMRDDTCLLKDPVPYSPDSVAVEWVSRSTTPNASG